MCKYCKKVTDLAKRADITKDFGVICVSSEFCIRIIKTELVVSHRPANFASKTIRIPISYCPICGESLKYGG